MKFEVDSDDIQGAMIVTVVLGLFWLMTSCMGENGHIFESKIMKEAKAQAVLKEAGL